MMEEEEHKFDSCRMTNITLVSSFRSRQADINFTL